MLLLEVKYLIVANLPHMNGVNSQLVWRSDNMRRPCDRQVRFPIGLALNQQTKFRAGVIHRTDGEMARGKYLEDFAASHGLKTITIADLVRYLEVHPEEALADTGAKR